MAKVKPIPDGYHALTPYLYITGAAEAIEFYKKALGAKVVVRMPGPDGKGVMHAELQIGDSRIMMAEANPKMGSSSPAMRGGCTAAVHAYVPDADKAFARAVKAGAKVILPPTDMFWGDRFSKISDPFGHEWALATHKEDVTPKEMKKRMAEMFSDPKNCPGT